MVYGSRFKKILETRRVRRFLNLDYIQILITCLDKNIDVGYVSLNLKQFVKKRRQI